MTAYSNSNLLNITKDLLGFKPVGLVKKLLKLFLHTGACKTHGSAILAP